MALIAGAGLVAAFAPLNLYGLALLSPAALLLGWRKVTPMRAAWRGLLFGFGLFGFGVSWLLVSFQHIAGVGTLTALSLTTLFILVLACFPALLGYLYVRLFADRPAFAQISAFGAGWVLLEWVRSHILTGFPWLSLGYSQTDSPLAGFAPLIGVPGISLLCALLAAMLANSLFARQGHRLPGVLLLVVLLGGVGQWLLTLSWSQPVGAPLEVALLQGNIGQERKWEPSQRLGIEDRYMDMFEATPEQTLIILPETALPEYDTEASMLLDAIDTEARRQNKAVLLGIPVKDSAEGSSYNGVLALGIAKGRYYKRHLVPVGEYQPYARYLPGLRQTFETPLSDFSPGPSEQAAIKAFGQAIGVSICYEDAWPALMRPTPGNLLVNVTNDAWFGDTLAPRQHLQITRMLALTLGRPVLRAANTGISAIVDARGQVQAHAPLFSQQTLRGTVQPRIGATPWTRFGDIPILFLATLLLTTSRLRRPSPGQPV